jgi:serine/threonine protein kinase/tetratricopeptide (TPR) repeat protein
MDDDKQALADVAAAILSGKPVDWPDVEAAATPANRTVLEELRLVSTLADAHRHLATSDDDAAIDAEVSHRYWGRLRLIEPIASGSFGDVFRAWDPRLRREVALKLIELTGDDPRHSAAVLHEGRLLARVRHPNVVTIYDAERIGSEVGLSMEFVQGQTLERRIASRGVFKPADTIAIGSQLCAALAAAHDAGVLHRDVKAANVVITPEDRVVLMDFGAARQRDDERGRAAGTPLYVAPEVLEGGESTAASDVYSVGVLLHHMVTGGYPVTASSVQELRAAHARRRLERERAVQAPLPNVPRRLAGVLARATHPDPAVRFASAAALGDALQSLRRSHATWVRGVLLVGVIGLAGVAGATWIGPRTDVPPAGAAAVAARRPVQIAVLPFVVRPDDTIAAVFREALASDLIARLQRFDNASVISAGSTFAVDAQKLAPMEIASRLNVSVLLAGTLEHAGDLVTVEARLLTVSDERILWSKRYSATPARMLDLQAEVIQEIAEVLHLTRAGGAQGWPTQNPEAFRLYVQGRVAIDRFSRRGTLVAHGLFLEALKHDPDFAAAHAALAEVYLHMNPAVPHLTAEEAARRGADAARRALELDATLPAAWAASAALKSSQTDWAGAERDYRQAIALGPGDVVVRQQFAQWLSLLGRADEAVAQAMVAADLDPESPRAILAVAAALRFGRRYEESMLYATKALTIDPDYAPAHHIIGHNYQGLGRLTEAIAAFERMGRPSGNLGHAYALAGRIDEARAVAAHFEKEYAELGLGAGELAQIYAGLGEIERAFGWLERVHQTHAAIPSTFKVAVVWDPLRADPRFDALLKKYRLD